MLHHLHSLATNSHTYAHCRRGCINCHTHMTRTCTRTHPTWIKASKQASKARRIINYAPSSSFARNKLPHIRARMRLHTHFVHAHAHGHAHACNQLENKKQKSKPGKGMAHLKWRLKCWAGNGMAMKAMHTSRSNNSKSAAITNSDSNHNTCKSALKQQNCRNGVFAVSIKVT